jgi:hypothetical protein
VADGADRGPAFRADQIEALARAIHAGYLRHQRDDGKTAGTIAAAVPWDELAEAYRESNRNHAADIARKLAAVGCAAEPTPPSAVPTTAASEPLFTFDPAELESLAEMEHDRWSRERESQGWTLGPERDDTAKRTPYLVPYADLPEAIKDYDRMPVRDMPKLLAAIGFRVVRG